MIFHARLNQTRPDLPHLAHPAFAQYDDDRDDDDRDHDHDDDKWFCEIFACLSLSRLKWNLCKELGQSGYLCKNTCKIFVKKYFNNICAEIFS